MIEILAKSSGEKSSLKEHSNYIKDRALNIFEETYLNSNDYYYDSEEKQDYREIVRVSALLHDIGKCTSNFQNILNGIDNKCKDEYLHNEIGWAFLERYLNFDLSYKHFITDCVLYHHGIKRYKKDLPTVGAILETVSKDDIVSMKNYLLDVLGDVYLTDSSVDYSIPKYYGENVIRNDKNEDVKKMFFRFIIVSADRMVDLDEDVSIYRNIPSFSLDEFSENERLKNQKEISENPSKNIIVNATAGFGKTLTGLLWNIKSSDRKMIWVCPRNTVAESVYKGILSELENIKCDLKVELFLTSETKKKNHDSEIVFNSDIIITNIDNFLSPTLNNSILSRLYYISKCDLVFDEYHEFVTKEAYFSLFVNMVKMRTMFTDSRTIMLSATPVNIHKLIDPRLNNTEILPSVNSHYPSAHSEKYKLNLIDSNNIEMKDNSLYIYNNISNAQVFKSEYNDLDIFHSNFESDRREEIFNSIYDRYGKNSERVSGKKSVCSTLIIQASIDVSFNHLYESAISHMATAQRIGRVQRWGDIKDECSINIFKPHNEREIDTVNKLYSTDLMSSWYDFLKEKNVDSFTLDAFYELYNEYNSKEDEALTKYLNKVYRESTSNLSNIDFIFTKNIKSDDNIIKSGSNKLRCSDAQIFFISRRVDGTWSEPFTKSILYGFDRHFRETSKTIINIRKTMKSLSGDVRFDYGNKHRIGRLTIDAIRRIAVFNNTPYITYNTVYSDEYGLIDKNLLESFE